MKKRVLGPSDLVVSRLALGTSTWGTTTDKDDAAKQIIEFVDAGGNLVDTADIYAGGKSENILGELLGTVVPRSSVVLATKAAGVLSAGPPFRHDASRAHLLAALDGSLRRLGTDHVDLWQMHAWDPHTPLDETLSAIDTAISTGRVRHAGVSNYSGWQAAKAATSQIKLGRAPLVSIEVEYSLLERGVEREVVPAAVDFGIGILPWAPLGRGVLTGKYRGGVPAERENNRFFKWYVGARLFQDRTVGIVESVAAAARETGASPLAVALAWVRDRPSVVAPVVGARTVEQLRESLQAEDFELPGEVRHHLDEVSAPYVGYPEAGI
jgi:aryl-alcohol dehydrogenase-like predicted oxidoreductase